jgi:hypothetical protein
MRELRTCQIALLEDRDTLKWKVNLSTGDRIYGFIVPVNPN